MAIDFIYTPSSGVVSTAAEAYDVSCVEMPSGKPYDNTNGELATTCTYANTRIAMAEINSSGRFGVKFPSTMPIGLYEVAVILREGAATIANTDPVVAVVSMRKNNRSNYIMLDSAYD